MPDDHLDDGGVPLLVATHTAGTEGLGEPCDVVVLGVLHQEAGDHNVETVAVARGNISDVEPPLLGCGVRGVEVDDAGVGADTLTAHIVVVTRGEAELGGEETEHHHHPHYLLTLTHSASHHHPRSMMTAADCAAFHLRKTVGWSGLPQAGGKYKAAGRKEKC